MEVRVILCLMQNEDVGWAVWILDATLLNADGEVIFLISEFFLKQKKKKEKKNLPAGSFYIQLCIQGSLLYIDKYIKFCYFFLL